MSDYPFRVGIIGLKPETSWAARAHLPALRMLDEYFHVAGVANSHRESSEMAAVACGIPHAFDNAEALVASPDIDIVTVAVKVPNHFDLVKMALDAGKHVYCEWPLGNGLAEAETLASLAREKRVVAVIGTQARVAPQILFLRDLIEQGYIGDVLSTTVKGWGKAWGATLDDSASRGYLLDEANGATLLTIPLGHTLAAIHDVLGDFGDVSSVMAKRRAEVLAEDSGEMLSLRAPDQVLFNGRLSNDVPIALHYVGGMPPGVDGLVWDIQGSDGNLRLTAPTGHSQMVPLSLAGAQGVHNTLERFAVPEQYLEGGADDVIAGNVARVYARMADDLIGGSRTAPTFDDAVALHRVMAAIEASAQSGERVSVDAPSRRLPGRARCKSPN